MNKLASDNGSVNIKGTPFPFITNPNPVAFFIAKISL